MKYEPRIILSVGGLRVFFAIKLSCFYIRLLAGCISFEGPPVFVCWVTNVETNAQISLRR